MESEWEIEGEGGREYIFSVLCMLSLISSRPSILCVNTLYVRAGS